MANKKISDLTELAEAPALGDLLPLVDISDTTDAVTGTTKKNKAQYGLGSQVNAQTGTTYTVLTTDFRKLVTHTNGSAIAVTLPQAGATFPAGWWCDVQNRGAGAVTITPTTSTIDGAASLVLNQNEGCRIVSDGTNYFTQRGKGSGSAGGAAGGDLAGSYPNPTVSQSSTSFALTGDISPAQITANQDDYNPTGLSTASVLRLNTDASRNITSIAGGADGRVLIIHNVGSFNVVLKDDDGATGTAANRFALSGDVTLAPDQCAILQYDSTTTRWRLLSSSALGGAPSGPAGGDLTGTYPNPSVKDNLKDTAISFIIDGGGATITTGIKGDIEIPFACTILAVTMLADQSGSVVVDIWKDTYTNYPPTDADSITASAVPTISTATKSQDSTLTGWTTSISASDILRFNVDSATSIQRVLVSLKVRKT